MVCSTGWFWSPCSFPPVSTLLATLFLYSEYWSPVSFCSLECPSLFGVSKWPKKGRLRPLWTTVRTQGTTRVSSSPRQGDRHVGEGCGDLAGLVVLPLSFSQKDAPGSQAESFLCSFCFLRANTSLWQGSIRPIVITQFSDIKVQSIFHDSLKLITITWCYWSLSFMQCQLWDNC